VAVWHLVQQDGLAYSQLVRVSDAAIKSAQAAMKSSGIESPSSLREESIAGDKINFVRKRASCAVTYARRLSQLLSPAPDKSKIRTEIEAFVLDRMAHSVSSAKRSAIRCPPDLVINAAPVSSGTRSFFLATALMNLPSAHYRVTATGNCSLGSAKTGAFMEEIGTYGGVPYSNKWWSIINTCPRTKTVLTLVNSSKWFDTRKQDLARISYKRWPSTFPIPFEPPKDSEIIRSHFQLKSVTKDTGAQAYSLFMDLVKCSVSWRDLVIIDYTQIDSPAQFWGKLNSFLGAGLGASELQDLIAAGLPYWGHSECFVGSPSRPCPAFFFKENRVSYKGVGLPGPCK
jgi:hypothetical protein